MAHLRFTDVQDRPTEILDFTSVTLDEFGVLCTTPRTGLNILKMGKWDRLTEPNLRLTLLTFCSMLSNDSKYLSSRCFPG